MHICESALNDEYFIYDNAIIYICNYVYIMYILCVYYVYIMYILCVYYVCIYTYAGAQSRVLLRGVHARRKVDHLW
jgi:hypothetical protein